ncbi:MAG: DUF2254 domain-containing protein [Actinomycetota bacterium]|nr:DUF2254 domain-containing protein [Actinomycetota bacterium]
MRRGERGEAFHLALVEFLAGALLFAFAIVALGGVVYALDTARPAWLEPIHDFLSAHFFRSTTTTSGLLQTIAATVITVASITFSLLLVAIQQSASSFTAQVFDQFLRRRTNQFYVGFFVGLGAYVLLQAATVHSGFNPTYGATLAVVLSVVAVALLLVLVYSAVNQMRPVVIVEAIHDHLIEARARQLRSIVVRTRRTPELESPPREVVRTDRTGFVTAIDLDAIQRAIDSSAEPCEVVLEVSIGSFVAFGDPLAAIHTADEDAARRVAAAMDRGITRQRQRNIDDVDAAFGIEQLETVGWTSISGAKHNPQAARLVVAQLRDVLARMVAAEGEPEYEPDTAVVYHDDVPDVLMRTLESLAVVTADSQQHQVAADIVEAFAFSLDRLPGPYRERAVDVLMRTLPALASHPPTLALERALRALADALGRADADDAARLVEEGLDHLRQRIGTVQREYTPR